MAEAATPVDAEKATANRAGSLLGSITPVVDGSDYETPDILSPRLDSAQYGTEGATRDRSVRWVNGYTFYPDDCYGGHLMDPCQVGHADVPAFSQLTAIGVTEPVHPFIVEATDQCSTFGAPEALHIERLKRKFYAVRSTRIAKEWWRGDQAQASSWTENQYLAKAGAFGSGGASIISGVYGYISALAALEQAIANQTDWGRGVIHATPRVVSHWIAEHMVRAVPNPPNVLMTELGTIVIADSGYDGSGPGDSQAGLGQLTHVQWAYVSGIPQIRLGQVYMLDTDDDHVAVDRSTNTRTIRMWQFASVAQTPCIHSGVIVNLGTAISVPGS